MSAFHVVIPARYASSRLPGKPLRDIAGKTMIERVYRQSLTSAGTQVIVATDDERIASVVEGFGGRVAMTSPEHASGTDRLAEVVTQLGLANDEIVVNVQGDEPLIPAAVIDQVALNLSSHPEAGVATLCEPIVSIEEFRDPNIVKAVFGTEQLALYFSRAPIPWPRDQFAEKPDHLSSADPEAPGRFWRHLGIYAYRVATLKRFVSWPLAELEALEALEQLRFLSNGVKIHIAPACESVPGGVDTEADLAAVTRFIKQGDNQ